MTSQSQRGGTVMGLVIGLVIGLGLALAVAVYVTKVPTPFSNNNQPRSSAQDVQEAEKNKNWNPNGSLQPKLAEEPFRQPDVASTDKGQPLVNNTSSSIFPSWGSGQSAPTPAVSADPLGDWVKAQASQSAPSAAANQTDPFFYMVQVGAYRNRSDADALKAQLALIGLDAAVSQRDQAGRVVYRVRVGPFDTKNDAERTRNRLQQRNIENTLVRVQR